MAKKIAILGAVGNHAMLARVSILMRVAYDGTAFHGFARQVETRTVQGELETALSDLYRAPIEIRGASRTDAGVHARGQLVAYDPVLPIPCRGVVSALDGRLPADLTVYDAWEEHGADNGPVWPRFGNGGKHYQYQIRCVVRRDPFVGRFAWHLHRRLDLDAMQLAANYFAGEHDFAGFRAVDCQASTTIRRVRSVRISSTQAEFAEGSADDAVQHVVIDVDGEAFLKNMVRIMVGSLVEVGCGRRKPEFIRDALVGRKRELAGPTAPACGLTLMQVYWQRGVSRA